jgi:Uma2 family endonuclease
MPMLVMDPPPAEIETFLERRRQWGADLHDEVWEGVYRVVPAPDFGHSATSAQVARMLAAPASAAELTVTDAFNLGNSKDDFRVPDVGLHRPGAGGTWLPTAALVVEVVSPGDDSWKKLSFYAAHGVDELLIVDPRKQSVDWLGLVDGEYRPIERSGLIDLSAAELLRRIEWV